MPNFVTFLSYAVLACFTPGPNNITAMTNAGQNGFKKGLRFCFGIGIGFVILMAVCAMCTSVLYAYLPKIEPVLKYLGAGYIFWLAVVIVRDKPHKTKKEFFKVNSILSGILLQFVNPKAILFGFTNFATFVLPYYESYFVVAAFVFFLGVIGFVAALCWAVFGVVFQKLFDTHRRLMNGIMAAFLVYCGIIILFPDLF